MKRKSIVSRSPVVSRTAIFNRTPCFVQPIHCDSCALCHSYKDCSGYKYVDANSSESSDFYRVIHVDETYTDWEELTAKIWELSDQGVYLRFIIDKAVPKEVLWAVSYSERNVLQININMLKFEENVKWAQKLVSIAGNCGMYVVLFLHPIIPDLVKSYQVVDILDRFRNTVYFHTTLKFSEIIGVKESDGYLNFNGTPVSTKYLERTPDGWRGTTEYMKKFMELVNSYAIPRKMSVSICGEIEDCTGLGGRYVTKS